MRSMRRVIACCLALSGLFTISLGAFGSFRASAATARLHGVVRDSRGEPIPGVLVKVYCELNEPAHAETITNEAGEYAFDGGEPEPVFLTFTGPAGLGADSRAVQSPTLLRETTLAANVVAPETRVDVILASEVRTYPLRGTIQIDGSIPDVPSQLLFFDEANLRRTIRVESDGTFVADLMPGRHNISLSTGNFGETYFYRASFTMPESSATFPTINFETIAHEVEVVTAAGVPAFTTVTISGYDHAGPFGFSTWTPVFGTKRVRLLRGIPTTVNRGDLPPRKPSILDFFDTSTTTKSMLLVPGDVVVRGTVQFDGVPTYSSVTLYPDDGGPAVVGASQEGSFLAVVRSGVNYSISVQHRNLAVGPHVDELYEFRSEVRPTGTEFTVPPINFVTTPLLVDVKTPSGEKAISRLKVLGVSTSGPRSMYTYDATFDVDGSKTIRPLASLTDVEVREFVAGAPIPDSGRQLVTVPTGPNKTILVRAQKKAVLRANVLLDGVAPTGTSNSVTITRDGSPESFRIEYLDPEGNLITTLEPGHYNISLNLFLKNGPGKLGAIYSTNRQIDVAPEGDVSVAVDFRTVSYAISLRSNDLSPTSREIGWYGGGENNSFRIYGLVDGDAVARPLQSSSGFSQFVVDGSEAGRSNPSGLATQWMLHGIPSNGALNVVFGSRILPAATVTSTTLAVPSSTVAVSTTTEAATTTTEAVSSSTVAVSTTTEAATTTTLVAPSTTAASATTSVTTTPSVLETTTTTAENASPTVPKTTAPATTTTAAVATSTPTTAATTTSTSTSSTSTASTSTTAGASSTTTTTVAQTTTTQAGATPVVSVQPPSPQSPSNVLTTTTTSTSSLATSSSSTTVAPVLVAVEAQVSSAVPSTTAQTAPPFTDPSAAPQGGTPPSTSSAVANVAQTITTISTEPVPPTVPSKTVATVLGVQLETPDQFALAAPAVASQGDPAFTGARSRELFLIGSIMLVLGLILLIIPKLRDEALK